MTKAQKERYLELRSIVDLSEEQAGELEKLTQLALAEGLDLETMEPVDRSAMTEVEVSDIVKAAVEDQIFGLREEILDKVSKNATQDDIEKTVKKYAQEVDSDEIVAKVAKAVPQAESLSKEDLTEAFSESIKNLRTPSKMEHPSQVEQGNAPLIQVPFGKTTGNLTVASKQLHNVLCGKHLNEDIPETSLRIAEARGASDLDNMGQKSGIMVSTSAGFGDELVNRDLSSDLQYRLYLNSALASALQGSEIQMPSQPFDLPLITTRPKFYAIGENTDPTAGDVGTGTITLDAKKLIGVVDYTYEVDEDAVVSMLPMIQSQLALGAADAFEKAVLISGSGDTKSSADSGGIDGTDPRALYADSLFKEGKASLVASSTIGDGLEKADEFVATMRGKLGAAGVNSSDMLLVVSVQGYNDLIQCEATLTADKVGASARILTGAATSIYGIPVVVSQNVYEKVDLSTGVTDGSTVDGQRDAVLVHMPSWKVGVRRGFTIETDANRKKQVNSVIASFRRAFVQIDTGGDAHASLFAQKIA